MVNISPIQSFFFIGNMAFFTDLRFTFIFVYPYVKCIISNIVAFPSGVFFINHINSPTISGTIFSFILTRWLNMERFFANNTRIIHNIYLTKKKVAFRLLSETRNVSTLLATLSLHKKIVSPITGTL